MEEWNMHPTWLRRSILLSLAVAPISLAQQFTLQHTNSVPLGSQFFGPDTANSLPGSGNGTNPISVAFDGTDAYVGGQNNLGVTESAGIVRVGNLFSTGAATMTPLASSQISTTAFTGFIGLTADSSGVYSVVDRSSGGQIRKYDSSGSVVWTLNPFDVVSGWRPSNIDVDPLAINGTPGLGMTGIGSGRRSVINPSTGSIVFGPSGFTPAGGIINTSPSTTIGSTYRGIAFDDAGNILVMGEKGIGFGNRDTATVDPDQYNRFKSNAGTVGATTPVIVKEQNLNPGQDVDFLEGTGPNKFMVFNSRAGLDATTSITLTDATGGTSTASTRGVHIRKTDGTLPTGIQSSLLGDEDGIGGAFTGTAKGLAVGKDSNNNPVLFVVSLEEKKLDVYSLEPTWISGSGTWGNNSNWLAGLNPNSGLQNARFANTGGTIAIEDSRTTKNLKLDSVNSYGFEGSGTLVLDGPGTWGAQIQVLNGSHSIDVPITLNKSANFTVINAADILQINGEISAAGKGVTKRGAGTAIVKALRLSALSVQGGTLTFGLNGTASGTGKTGSLVISGATDAWTSTLDIKNNAIAVDYTGTSPLADIQNQVKSGYASGAWTGTGIRSSIAALSAIPTKGAIAVAENSELLAAPDIFNQVTTDADTVLVMYTLAGDATMDRKVDTLDFNMLAGNFGTGSKWTQGDSNYDGVVDSQDFNAMVGNFGATVPLTAPSLGSTVPEPASLGALSMALSALALRRRK
jgi:hypothetical protein